MRWYQSNGSSKEIQIWWTAISKAISQTRYLLGILCMENVSRVRLWLIRTVYSGGKFDQILIAYILFSCRSFDVENHITVYPSNYRGRPVTASNIQDYISNIVSKYFQVGLPPWQICVIPVIRTKSSARAEDTTAAPSTSTESASGNDTEEEQQTSSDPMTVRHIT